MKKLVAFLLALTYVFGLVGCGKSSVSVNMTEATTIPQQIEVTTPMSSESTAKIEPDAELLRAISAGIMPAHWCDELDKTITFNEYTAVLTRIVELWNKDSIERWQEITALAANSQEPMQREDGLLMLSYMWIMMGKGSEHVYGYLDEVVNPDVYRPQEFVDAQWSLLSWNYPYFPDWETVVYDIYHANYMAGAICAFLDVMSPVSGEFVISRDDISWDDVNSLRPQEDLTYEDAIRMAIRIAEYSKIEFNSEWQDYVSVSEVDGYNHEIITDELLNAPSQLPNVTQSELPSAWKGAGISARKDFVEEYLHFEESDVAFLKENGFNFTKLFLNFQTLRYPNYPADPYLINRNELEELDQLLAWCMEYGVHLQISMSGYMDKNGNNYKETSNGMPADNETWALTQAYWVMLAERYADIPSKYLSFDLCNEEEPQPKEIGKHKEELSTLVAMIRSADPDRVLLYSQQNQGNTAWTEAFASLGVAVGCHPYVPNFVATADKFYCQQNPYAEVIWPTPYFPMGNAMSGGAPIQISGDIDGAEMGIHIWNSGSNAVLGIYVDGQKLETIKLEGVPGPEGEQYYYDTIYRVQIPENANEISIKVERDYARIDTIIIEKNGVLTTMMATDTCAYLDYTDPLPLIVNGDGTYTNSEDLMFDAERIYQTAIEPYQKIAQQYGVGFMVNEFGMFGTNVYWDIDAVVAFHETYLELLEGKDIPWCYCEIFNVFPKHLIVFYGEESQWAGATEEDISYTLRDGSTVTIKVCKELLDIFRMHTVK